MTCFTSSRDCSTAGTSLASLHLATPRTSHLSGPPLTLQLLRRLCREEYEEHKSDVWYAVPLSEIDFTQCRKCTPSYRALPKDYPKAKCTERSEEEARVLNDQVRYHR